MNWTRFLTGGALFISGLVFFLQGINLLPGSFMTGDPRWAVIGGAMAAIGAVLVFLSG